MAALDAGDQAGVAGQEPPAPPAVDGGAQPSAAADADGGDDMAVDAPHPAGPEPPAPVAGGEARPQPPGTGPTSP